MNTGHIDNMCLAEFAANYSTSYKNEDDANNVLPPPQSESASTTITLHGFGKMHKRKREVVIRFRMYNKDKEPSNYYRAKLMLYYPWRNENMDLLKNCSMYEEQTILYVELLMIMKQVIVIQ